MCHMVVGIQLSASINCCWLLQITMQFATPFFLADNLTCESRKSSGETHFVNNKPQRGSTHNTGALERDDANASTIDYAGYFSAMTQESQW